MYPPSCTHSCTNTQRHVAHTHVCTAVCSPRTLVYPHEHAQRPAAGTSYTNQYSHPRKSASLWYTHPRTPTKHAFTSTREHTLTPSAHAHASAHRLHTHSHTRMPRCTHVHTLTPRPSPWHVPAASRLWVPAGLEAGAGASIVTPLTDGVGSPQGLGIWKGDPPQSPETE